MNAQLLAVAPTGGEESMAWETPAFAEIKMDAEIGSYQDDFDRDDSDST